MIAAALILALLAAPVALADQALVTAESRYTAGDPSPRDGAPWWTTLRDPHLDALMAEGLRGNRDLRGAWERVDQSEALAAQALSPLLPAVSFDVAANTAPTDTLGFQFGGLPFGGEDSPELYGTGSAMVNLGWEVDVWGRNLLSQRANRFEAAASRGDRDALAIALSTRIASAYYDVVAGQARVALVEEQIRTSAQLLELVELRLERGEATALDVLQQRQQAASVSTLLPRARTQHRLAEQQLAVLVGLSPLEPAGEVGEALPEITEPAATGAPADLLDARPDLVAAAARLDAATDLRRTAERRLLPSVQVSAQAGWQAFHLDELDTQASWGAGASLSVPLFQGGAGWAGLRHARSARDAAEQAYAQAVLLALQEVEGALVHDQEIRAELEAVRLQEQAARQDFEESRERYLGGLTSYLSVLAALSAWQQSQLAELETRRAVVGARIQLYDALGGTWPAELATGDAS